MGDKHSFFIAVTLLVHVVAFLAGVFFFGAEYAVILLLGWTLVWLGYCNHMHMHDEGAYADAIYLRLVLIGGPLCWIICPWALIPKKHDSNTEPVPWVMLLKLYVLLADSVLKLLRIVFALAQKDPEITHETKATVDEE